MTRTTITPVLRYRNAGAAARWLGEAFGFYEHDSAQEPDGQVRYILLGLGDSFVLVRPVANLGLDDLMVQPEAVGGANTQVCYLTIANMDDHRARAAAAGATIEIEPQDDGLSGRFYTCRDPEGHLWSFGTRTYGAGDALSRPQGSAAVVVVPRDARRPAGRSLRVGISAAAAVLLIGGGVCYLTYAGGAAKTIAAVSTGPVVQVEDVLEQLAQERGRRAAAEDTARDAAARLAGARSATADVRQSLERAQAELTREHRQKDEAVAALAAATARAEEHRQAKDGALGELLAAREQIAQEQAKRAALAKSASQEAQVQRERVAKLQQESRAEKEQLQAAEAVARAARSEIEALRGAAQQAPKRDETGAPAPAVASVPDAAAQSSPAPQAIAKSDAPETAASQPEPAEPDTAQPATPQPSATQASTAEPTVLQPDAAQAGMACALAAQGKIPSGHKASNTWVETNLARLCQGAEGSPEPARCFEELIRGKVSWGGSSVWATSNALRLCGGTRNARRTIDCFSKRIASEEAWQLAIQQCKTTN